MLLRAVAYTILKKGKRQRYTERILKVDFSIFAGMRPGKAIASAIGFRGQAGF